MKKGFSSRDVSYLSCIKNLSCHGYNLEEIKNKVFQNYDLLQKGKLDSLSNRS